MTMNTKPKMTAEQRLQRAMERNEAELQKAEEKRKQLKEQRRALEPPYLYPRRHVGALHAVPAVVD